MKIILFHIFNLITVTVLLSSCGRQTAARHGGGDTLTFRYARRLMVEQHDGYTVATLYNPWHEGKVLHRYVLVPRTADPAALGLSAHDGTIVRTPLRRSVVFTTVHCALMEMLGQEQHIAGVADLKYIKLPYIHRQVKAGRIVDCGDGMSPVIEKIIDLHPDAIFLSPFENSGGYGKLEEIDIPIIECAEYMEGSPLARAEWMRFYGMLFGCEQRADSLFEVVDSSYHALKTLAASHQAENGKTVKSKTVNRESERSVLLDKVTGSVWYVPGGRSTIGQMLADARCHYPWAADEHSGSVSLPFETVLEKAGESDIWLFRFSADHLISYSELLAEHPGYSQFRAFRNKQVYGCNVEQSLFYEESPFRPDYLLSDFIKILHPEVPGLPALRYYQKLHE